MPAESQQRSLLPRRSAVRSGLATGFSTLAVSGSAVIAGAYLAQKFGRDAETDGFLAAYGVYLVIVLAAQAFRLVLVPDLTRASAEDRLTGEFFSYLAAFIVLAVPACLLTVVLAPALGEVLTGNLPLESAAAAADALVWVVPAAFLQLLAAVAASALAAAQSYTVAAIGYALGALSTLAIFIPLAGSQGLVSLAWGVFANGAVAFAIPFVALLRFGHLRGRRRGGIAIGPRLWRLVQAAAVPLALQGLYVIALRGASGLGEGNQTSLTYAYLLAATLVAATASSLSLISSEPLTRRGLDVDGAAAHVVHAAWVSLTLIGAATGVFALVGGDLVHLVLGSAFAGDVGEEIGNLVIFLAPWMIAQVSFSVTFPILFVLERPQILLPLALAATIVHIFVTVGLRELWGLEGLAIALGVTTFGVIVVLMASVSTRMLRLAAVGIARSAIVVAAIAVASFAVPAFVVPDVPAAVIGVALYFGALWLLRPRGLVESWHYVRALHQ